MHPELTYVIEVRMPTGANIRGAVIEKSLAAHVVGQVVKVEVHSKNNEIGWIPAPGSTRSAGCWGWPRRCAIKPLEGQAAWAASSAPSERARLRLGCT